jgi:predicted transcriptional regulator
MIREGVTPTMRDIGEGIGLSSIASVHRHFSNLVKRGDIELKGRSRYRVKGVKYVYFD